VLAIPLPSLAQEAGYALRGWAITHRRRLDPDTAVTSVLDYGVYAGHWQDVDLRIQIPAHWPDTLH